MDDDFDFSPLSDDERAAAQQQEPEDARKTEKPTVSPGDAEPPEMAAARLFARPPDKLWPYRIPGGAILFWVCRWNVIKDGKPDKVILPLSWFDGAGWRFAAWPAPRPLYNLDKIVANPGAKITVCEGEKDADAAALVFPDRIPTTSSGGAGAASITDWTPLAGRDALIWPDYDEAGAKYGLEVATILADLECEVSIVDVAKLAAIDGGARGPDFDPHGWGAGNAIKDWKDLDALRQAVLGLAKPFSPAPAYVSFAPYTMDAGGLTIEKYLGRGKAKQMQTVWISAPFEVLGECRDPRGSDWGKMLRWRDPDGREHVGHVADADLQRDPSPLSAMLADNGLRVDPAGQRDLVRYLSAVQVKRRVTVVHRTGWHEIGGQRVFVLPGESIRQRGGQRVILDAAAHGPYEKRGSLDDWRNGVAKRAIGHALPVIAISAALTGPLLDLAGAEGGGAHFCGPSSIGKTTLLQMSASVWGRGDSTGYVRSWRATANGLEGVASGATDTALILDELGQVEAREFAAAPYMLANGAGKARAHRDGSLRDPRTWRLMFISSGEVPMEAKLAEDRGKKTRAGQLVRMLNITADRGLGFGVFDHAGSDGEAAAFAKQCKLAAASSFGTAGPEFVRRLIADDVRGSDVRSFVNGFVAAEVPACADGQVDRAAQRLGIIAAAGEFATAFGLTGWREGEAREAAAWTLKRWIDARGGTDPAEVRQAIETVRHFIEAHGEARFDRLYDYDNAVDPDPRPVPNRAGWRKGEGNDRRWLFLPEVWKQEVCAGLDPKFVAKVLADRGALAKESDGNMRVERIAGTTKRVYVITPRIFEGSEA
jgi:uncharacterized protein (DUF927 family)